MPRPPGMPSPAMAVNQDELLIKLGMKRKKKWSLGGQTKRTNWKSVSCILNGFDHKLMNQWQGDHHIKLILRLLMEIGKKS